MNPSPPPSALRSAHWSRRLLFIGVGLVAALIVVLISAAVVPREWAQRVGNQADGGLLSGSALGLFYGSVFTVLPLLVIWVLVRFRPAWKWWAGSAVVAVLLALPNLMTLSIVVGTGNAAHAGERILDVKAPGFRGGTLVGVILGAVVVGVFAYLIQMRRRTQRRADRLEAEVRRSRDDQKSERPADQ